MKTKRIISLLAALILCLSFTLPAFAMVEPSESFYCADYANVLTDSTEQMICTYNGALEWECQGAQIVVVTVDYLGGMYCDEYAYQLFNDWGVGSGQNNNGMLLLLATEEGKAWLSYGLGFQSKLSTKDVDRMLDKYFWKDFDAGKFDSAVSRLFKELVKWYDGVYGTDIMGASDQPHNYSSDTFFDAFDLIVRILLFIILISVICGGGRSVGRRRLWTPLFFLLHSRNDRGGRGGFGGSFGGGFGGGFGGHHGSGHGGGGFSGGGGGRR